MLTVLLVGLLMSACTGRDLLGGSAVGGSAVGGSAVGGSITALGPAARALAELPVRARAPAAGYSRSAFGDAWTDDVAVDGGHNGCDTRNDILRRDLQALVVKPGTHGCVALTGTLADPYTGTAIGFRRGANTSDLVQIDHLVALANAWATGGQLLTAQRRQEFANDPRNLLAVQGDANQSKGSDDASQWLPANRAERCRYVARQIAVKGAYALWVTAAEKSAMQQVLAGCPAEPLPQEAQWLIPALHD